MASGDYPAPRYMTYSKSRVPVIGALIDYIDTSAEYLWNRTLSGAENMHTKKSKDTLSVNFIVFVCLLLGLVCNIKLEVVTLDEKPLPNDLHIVMLSDKYKLYVDDIDVSKILCCIEASDALLIIICCFLIFNSSFASSPLSEYLFLPWLGAALRGLVTRQVPTFGALLYTMFVATQEINVPFIASFSLLFFVELGLWLQIVKLVNMRWESNEQVKLSKPEFELNPHWSNDEVPSIEVRNYVY
ncbi:uncharacterized protein [Battus philenor]|uniref:uncharacterized protein n=1 Tax=Battus philenor TaxID=42288 RepID=UPI0035D068FB